MATYHSVKNFMIDKIKKDQKPEMISRVITQETYKNKVIQEKLDDPGSFTLPCSLGPLTFNRCLCDLGASVSLMPLTTAKGLGIMEYKFCNLSLLLADGSLAHPSWFNRRSACQNWKCWRNLRLCSVGYRWRGKGSLNTKKTILSLSRSSHRCQEWKD